jgi:glycerate kinase
MSSPSALACPDSLKAVLSARDAAAALAAGFGEAGVRCEQLPLADGGEGTEDALAGRLPDGVVVVEAASVIPFDPSRLDVTAHSSRALGEALARVRAAHLYVGLGGTANMDAGAGLLEVLDTLPAPTTVLCDVQTTLYDAPRTFGPQKGATPDQVVELEARFRADDRLAPFASLPGSGAAGGLGAALAALGAQLVPGAPAVLDLLGFDAARPALVVSGEGASTPRPARARCRPRSHGAAPRSARPASCSAAWSSSRLRTRKRSRCRAIRRGPAEISSS